MPAPLKPSRNKNAESFSEDRLPARQHYPLSLGERLYMGAKEIRAWAYYGHRFYCPCCQRSFRKLLPFGVVLRPNARCPKCGSLERHRLLWLYLKQKTNLFTDRLRVLHFAPEAVFQNIFMSMPNLEYVSADLMSPLALMQMDITAVPFGDNAFDVILCNHVLEHVQDDQKAMTELFRVLKPGGWAILQSPLDMNRKTTFEDPLAVTPEDRLTVFGQHDHVRIYGCDYKERLENGGFTVRVDGFIHELDPALVSHFALPSEEAIYFCTK